MGTHHGMAAVARQRRAVMRKLGSVLAGAVVILGSTALGLAFADMVVSVERHRRSIAADVFDIANWFAGLDPFVVAGVSAVAVLIALTFLTRRLA
jgi:hypothetical protein